MVGKKFHTKFGEIKYYQLGQGDKLIVVIHGFLGRPFFVESLFKIFGDRGYSVVAPVLPGHGASFPLPEGFSFNDLYECVEKLLESFDCKEINLVGHSMGGALAFKLGHSGNLPIKKIVLVAPGLGRFRRKNWDYVFRFALDLRFDFPRSWFVRYFIAAIGREGQWQQIVFPWRMAHMVRTTQVDFEQFPEGRKALALWGKNDLITPSEDYLTDLAKIRNLSIHFHDGGHHWFYPRKEEFLKEVEEFL